MFAVDEKKVADALDKEGFILGGLIGKGAFSRCFFIEEKASGKCFACKVQADTPLAQREAAYLSKAAHPLFPAFYRCFSSEDVLYLCMEYVTGTDLECFLLRRKKCRPMTALKIVLSLCEGLRFLHEMPQMLLYRDLKPANIRICADGSVKLLDLGCVCEQDAADKSRAGTLFFAAPEQLCSREDRAEEITQAADVYALGRILLALLGISSPYFGNLSYGTDGFAYKGKEKKCFLELALLGQEMTGAKAACRLQHMGSVRQRLLLLKAGKWQKMRKKPQYVAVKNIWKST